MEDLNKKKNPFYDIYDLKSEGIPSEEEWALRMKELFPDEALNMKPSEGESEGKEMKCQGDNKSLSCGGAVEKDEQKEKYFLKLQKTKEDL